MRPLVRIPRDLFRTVLVDLERPHPHAAERVGFLLCRSAMSGQLSLAYKYYPVAEDDYLATTSVGACIGSDAIRAAMQLALDTQDGCFHVHLHGGRGEAWFSPTDLETSEGLVPSLQAVSPDSTHGAIVFSMNSGSLLALEPSSDRLVPGRLSLVGYPTRVRGGIDGPRTT